VRIDGERAGETAAGHPDQPPGDAVEFEDAVGVGRVEQARARMPQHVVVDRRRPIGWLAAGSADQATPCAISPKAQNKSATMGGGV